MKNKLTGKVTKCLGKNGVILHNSRAYAFYTADASSEIQKGSRVLFAVNPNGRAINVELDTNPVPAIGENMHEDNDTAIKAFKQNGGRFL